MDLGLQDGILTQFDDVVVRKVVEYIKVISTDKIQIVFKGGVEVAGEIGVMFYWGIYPKETQEQRSLIITKGIQ